MYGRKKFRPISKPVEVVTPVSQHLPTFICSKCKQIKTLLSGYSDINLTLDGSTKMQYRICKRCFDLLGAWIHG